MPNLFSLPLTVPVDSSGQPYAGAKLYFYAAGTLNHQAVYTTSALSVAHAQPVVADANGRFAAIYLNPEAASDYRIQLKTSADVLLYDQNNIPASGDAQTAADILAALLTVDGAGSSLDADKLDTYEATVFPRKAEDATISGAWTFSGTFTASNTGAISGAWNYTTAPTINSITVGYRDIPQNSQSAAYELVLADAGKHIYHPSADTTARTWTIPANASVAFPIGAAITFVNDTSAGVITIAITSDTLVLAGAGTTGSRTLAANGVATAVKVTATRWIISGTGLT